MKRKRERVAGDLEGVMASQALWRRGEHISLALALRLEVYTLIEAHPSLSAVPLALLPRSQLAPAAVSSHRLLPYRCQQTAAPAAPAKRGRLDNSAEFVVTKLDDLINWARKVGVKEREGEMCVSVTERF